MHAPKTKPINYRDKDAMFQPSLGYVFTTALDLLAARKKEMRKMSKEALMDAALESALRAGELNGQFLSHDKQRAVAVLTVGYALETLQKRFKKCRCWVAYIVRGLPHLSQASVYRYIARAKEYPDPRVLKDVKTLEDFRISDRPKSSTPARKSKSQDSTAADGNVNSPAFTVEKFKACAADLCTIAVAGGELRALALMSDLDRAFLHKVVAVTIETLRSFDGKLDMVLSVSAETVPSAFATLPAAPAA